MTDHADEPKNGSYVSLTDDDGVTRVYKRMDWLVPPGPDRWFRLVFDNPHGIPDEGLTVLSWAEVTELGPIGYIGRGSTVQP
jgi:hypothetical protein